MGRIFGGQSFSVDGKLFISGGGKNGMPLGNMWCYYPETNEFDSLQRMMVDRTFHTALLSLDKKSTFMIGGKANNNSYIAICERFDIKN